MHASLHSARHRVVIVGAGIAGLEALIALHELANDLVDVTLVTPSDHLTIKAWGVLAPFEDAPASAYDVERVCADHGAAYRQDAVHAVQRAHRQVLTRSGATLAYDSLIVAIG